MSEHVVTIQLSETVYQALNDVAQASGWPLEKVVLQCVQTGMPPLLRKVPDKYHEELLALNKLDDMALLEIAEGEERDLASAESTLPDRALMHRAYAYALLRWRGHPLPDPSEFLL